MKPFKYSIVLCLYGASAFASIPQGHITNKIDSHKAEIELRGLKEGDRVNLLAQTCEGPKVKLCRTEKVGTAVVSKVIDGNTSEIKIEGHDNLRDDLLIEKQ